MSQWQKSIPVKYTWLAMGLLVVALILLLYLTNQNNTADVGLNKGGITPDSTSADVGVNKGDRAPDFTLADLDGNQVSLSDFRAKTVFLNFWATWCPPCRAEMPEMEAVYHEYKDKDVVMIGVDIRETEGTVCKFVQENGYSWIFLLDTSGTVAADYEIKSIPSSFFLDKEGIIRAVRVGSMTKPAMETMLSEATR